MRNGSPPASDADLVAIVRAGDPSGRAYADLFERHWHVARAAAVRFGAGGDADDLAQEAMVRVFVAIASGAGPDSAFRAYLIAAVRNLAISRARRTQPYLAGDAMDLEELAFSGEEGRKADDDVVDRSLLAAAFHKVPDRYRAVLWHTVVEGMTPRELGPRLGMSANGVAVLAARARESLRRAWISVQLDDGDLDERCAWALRALISLQREDVLGRTTRDRLAAHLRQCARCRKSAVSVRVLARSVRRPRSSGGSRTACRSPT
ncbi:RNA polymerase sigma factor [Xylanimonas ulmi]|uniref:RNA polymerase sigma factor (Sigma-70 family) n=1 Tax=Xylanimonas ulmi TaxID=228973 RepID=A0A4Q7M1N7_9MICO|nr:sigma-70 family RNA polymerase sigma factor [Xylanibacterium ulmi]RZS60863.1 RNA polymerase sigma factor (sigma-70 family) [Xylanibacterium ulmi]